jgi:virginiamycin B lyase
MSIKPAKRFHLGADVGGQARERKSASVVLRQELLRAGAKALLLASLLLSIAVFSSAQDVTIKEYAVPSPPSGPNGITVGPDGALWFAESSSKGGFSEIGRITTAGAITEYPLPTGGGPELITAGPDGALWFTKAYTNQIGRITTTGVIEEYSLPRATHYAESYPTGIVAGPDGALWFAELLGNAIGRITTSGFILEYALPAPNSGPNGITVGPDGNLWFTESGGDRIGVITTAGVVTEYPLPGGRSPIRITAGPDGRLWFVNEVGNTIGAITTGGIVSEYPVRTPPPLFGLSLHGITVGPDGALWFTEAATNNIGRITTTGTVTEYPVPAANSEPLEITLGPDGALWFTEGGADKIGQIVLADTTPPAITMSDSPTVLWPPNGKMVPVTVSGTITDTGSGVNASSVGFAVSDEYGAVQPSGMVTLGPGGAYSFIVLLQASRLGADSDGRQYTITVSASDNAGNKGSNASIVTVVHDRRN